MKALIIVDLQNDFVEGGALAVPGGMEIIPLVNRLQERFELIVATQDWHPVEHGSHVCNHENREVGDIVDLAGHEQILWPAHCVQDTPGAEFVSGLHRDGWAAVFQKGTRPHIDSYSGFFDNHRDYDTGMADFLRERGVTEVYIAGLATDYCVKFTALDAVALGFKTTVITDACRGVNLNEGDVERALAAMENAGVAVANSQQIPGLQEAGRP